MQSTTGSFNMETSASFHQHIDIHEQAAWHKENQAHDQCQEKDDLDGFGFDLGFVITAV